MDNLSIYPFREDNKSTISCNTPSYKVNCKKTKLIGLQVSLIMITKRKY